MQRLANKQVVLGITGGIAAYKSADIVRRLREEGALVRAVMTENAKEFITPLTLQAVSGHPVHDDLFDLKAEAAMGHIELGRWADVILIAPASADFMARLLMGEADDLLTTLCLVTKAPIALAPAMNQSMWKNDTTQKNVQALKAKGISIFGPGIGSQACGDVGPGRLLEPIELVDSVVGLFDIGKWHGKNILITAGPTREAIDPVRFITNGSSGKMGYALAEAASQVGAKVTLISGPVSIPKPAHVHVVDIISVEDMMNAVMAYVKDMDFFFSVAAVGNYRCRTIATQKITKKEQSLTLYLDRTPDIVASVALLEKKPIIIGFAGETENRIENAKTKLKNKKMDMIIANDIGQGLGMGSDDNAVTVIWDDQQKEIAKTSKKKLARELIELVAECFI